jgi:hypothetical protein
MSHLNFPVVNLKQTIDAITKHDIRFEIYNEGDIKIDKNGITLSGEGPKIAWFKDPAGNLLSTL